MTSRLPLDCKFMGNIPAQMIVNTWRHIGFFGGVAPHPNLEEEEMNESHDPLALVIPHVSAKEDDEDHDMDASFEFQLHHQRDNALLFQWQASE